MRNHKCLRPPWKSHYCAQTYITTATSDSQELAPVPVSGIPVPAPSFTSIFAWHWTTTVLSQVLGGTESVDQVGQIAPRRHTPPTPYRWKDYEQESESLSWSHLQCKLISKRMVSYASPRVSIIREVLVQPCELNVACGTTTAEHPLPRAIQPTL